MYRLRLALASAVLLSRLQAQPSPRAINYADLAAPVRESLLRLGVAPPDFERFIERVETSTAEREREGENDHLIFYILQSQEFTKAPRIEPALSARQFVESHAIPPAAKQRLEQFARAKIHTERFDYFHTLVPPESAAAYLEEHYARAMKSLYAKEFTAKPDYYQTRGHSTDTQITANYAVWQALSVLKASSPATRIESVLIVGPGLDTAPRTGLVDRYPPQSYQPYATWQSLRDLGLSDMPRIRCVDINPRVIRFIRSFPQRRALKLEFPMPHGDSDFESWARDMSSKLASVPPKAAAAITAEKLNIVTQRLEEKFDLVIATNILLYFNEPEAQLAIANIESMMAPGAHFIHNELRPALDGYALAAGLAPIQARTIRIGEGAKAPLYDAFAIYQKPRVRK